MKQEVRKYTVTILNEPYTLLGDESERDVIDASGRVDYLMKEIGSNAPHVSSYHKAVLAALKLSLQLLALETEQKDSTHMVKKCIDDIEQLLVGDASSRG